MTIYGVLDHAIPVVFQSALLTAALVIGAGVLVRKQLLAGGVLPDEGITLRNIVEGMVEFLVDLAEGIMGEHARAHMGLVCSIFFFVLIANLLGLIPGFGGPTSFIETAAAWAVISFVSYNYAGIKAHGGHYLDHFMGPAFDVGGRHIRVAAPFFLPLELILHFSRILTLTIRLFANMFADHQVVAVWIGLVPFAVPAVFMGLGTFIAFLQAFVFALLTMIYIGGALEEAH